MPEREPRLKMAGDPIEDLADRINAVSTANHAFINASAGTGKTHTLTLRAIFLLLTVEAGRLYDPSATRRELLKAVRDAMRSLVLTTFTKKAASEMRDRVFRYLNLITGAESREALERTLGLKGDALFIRVLDIILERVPGQDFILLRRGAKALLERAPELQITTLHSFASLLLASYPVEAGIPLDARFESEDDPSEADRELQLVDIWIRRTVLEESHPRIDDLRRVLSLLPLPEFKSILRESLLRDWLAGALDEMIPAARAGEITPEQCLEAMEAWSSHVLSRKGRTARAQRIAGSLIPLLKGAREGIKGSWTGIAALIYGSRDEIFTEGRKMTPSLLEVMADLPADHLDRMRHYGPIYQAALGEALHTDSSEAWTAFRALLREFSAWGRENLLRETGIVSFNDMIRKAADLLGRHPQVQRREYSRLRAVLVDEFQDTDPDQLDMLRNLLARPDGSEREVLGFFVGDVKQSIYRFRDADVVRVQDFQDNYQSRVRCTLPVERIRLRTSFRSEPGIIDWANHLFTGLLDLEREDENLLAFRPARNPVPEWRLVDTGRDKDRAPEKRESAARAVLGAVREYMDGSDPNRSFRDILILCRSYNELDPVVRTLKLAGIPVIASGCRTFQLNPEVVDTVNLLIFLLDPLDTLAVASTLKSPVIGLSDAEIYRFFREADPVEVAAGRAPVPEFISGAPGAKLRKIIGLAGRLNDGRAVSPGDSGIGFEADVLLDRVGTDEDGPAVESLDLDAWIRMAGRCVPAEAYHHDWDLEGVSFARIKKVLEDFRQVCSEGAVPPLAWLLGERDKAVDRALPDKGFSEDVSLSDDSVSAVRVMSIHKAKGLEGRLVIIASWSSLLENGLGILPNYRNKTVYDFSDREGNPVRAFSLRWGDVSLESAGYPRAVELDKDMESCEARRIAYVSVTRPRERLLLITPSEIVSRKGSALRTEIETCLDAACDKGLLALNRWVEDGCPGESAAVGDPGLINPGSYWRLWEARRAAWEGAGQEFYVEDRFRAGSAGSVAADRLPGDEARGTEALPGGGAWSMETGSLVHAYLQRYLLDSGLDREKLAILGTVMEPPASCDRVIGRAAEILDRYYSGVTLDAWGRPLRERAGRAEIIAREFPVMLDFQGKVQYRIIDLILEEAGGLVVVDFKTGEKPSELPDRYRLQQEIYPRAVRLLAPGKPVSFEFWWLGGGA